MPYASRAQSAYIHAKAGEGVSWAKRFVRDAHGTHVPRIKRIGKRRKVRRHR
jgi:hypothetical protein